MRPLPNPPATPNERALASFTRERITGVVGAVLTLSQSAIASGSFSGTPGAGLELVTKNGLVLYPGVGANDYAIDGKTITLNTPAIAGDVFFVWYHYGSSQ